jgi:hypothetical protein
MIQANQPCDPRVHALATRLARACRTIVQACLREEEWRDADREFHFVIRSGLEEALREGSDEAPGPGVVPRSRRKGKVIP